MPTSPRAAAATTDPRLEVDRILLAGCLAGHLSPYITDPYLIQKCIVPWLLELQRLSPAELADPVSKRSPRAWHSTPLATAVKILEAVLDDWELEAVVRGAFRALAVQALGESVGAARPGSLPHVATAATLLGSEGRATQMLLAWADLRQALEWLLAIRRPRDSLLKDELPLVRSQLLPSVSCFACTLGDMLIAAWMLTCPGTNHALYG